MQLAHRAALAAGVGNLLTLRAFVPRRPNQKGDSLPEANTSLACSGPAAPNDRRGEMRIPLHMLCDFPHFCSIIWPLLPEKLNETLNSARSMSIKLENITTSNEILFFYMPTYLLVELEIIKPIFP
jgi:hypothetical protein